MMDLPEWCAVRRQWCRCSYSERCDRYDRETVVDKLKQEQEQRDAAQSDERKS